MNHVTDERTDRTLGRDLSDWLEHSIEELPDRSELPSPIRSDVLSRLSGTPQRRRWWPFRWFPFGIGATRSADAKDPRPEGRSKSMFTVARIVAAMAILALVSGLAVVAVPTPEGRAPLPGASMHDIDPADFGGFTGTMKCRQGEYGTTSPTDWGSVVEGETYSHCPVEVGDHRFTGNMYSVHDYYKYAGLPTWGVRNVSAVLTNDDGYWVSTTDWGYQQPEDGTMAYAMQWRGRGAYEGLSALTILSQDAWGLNMDLEGIIFPGELPEAPEPPIEAALAAE